MKSFVVLCLMSTVALCSATTCPSIVGYVADPDNSENYFMCLFYKPIQRSCGNGNVFDSSSRNCRPTVQARQDMPPIFTTLFPEMPPIITTEGPEATVPTDGETWRPTPSVVTTTTDRPTPPLLSTLDPDLPTPSVVTTSTARPTPPLISDETTPFPTPPLVTFTTDATIVPPVSTTSHPNPPISTTPPVVPISTTVSGEPSLPISTTAATPPNPGVSSTVPGVPVSTTTPGMPISTTPEVPTCPTCPPIVCPKTGIHRYLHPTYCHRFFLCMEGVFREMNCQTGHIFDHVEMRCMENGRCHINGWLFG